MARGVNAIAAINTIVEQVRVGMGNSRNINQLTLFFNAGVASVRQEFFIRQARIAPHGRITTAESSN